MTEAIDTRITAANDEPAKAEPGAWAWVLCGDPREDEDAWPPERVAFSTDAEAIRFLTEASAGCEDCGLGFGPETFADLVAQRARARAADVACDLDDSPIPF